MTDSRAPSEDSPGRALLLALAAMLAVALLVGGIIGLAILGAVRLSGVGASRADSTTEQRTLEMPEDSSAAVPAGPGTASPTARPRPAPPIRLEASPATVAPGGRITLSGDYPGGAEGTTLQVQRREGAGWIDFPVEARVSGSTFGTWVQTSRTGRSVFRVLDESAGKASNAATVQVW